jgi:hypothetical protein
VSKKKISVLFSRNKVLSTEVRRERKMLDARKAFLYESMNRDKGKLDGCSKIPREYCSFSPSLIYIYVGIFA